MYKISKISALVLGAIGAVLWVFLVREEIVTWDSAPMQWMFIISYVLLGLTILVAIVSGIMNIVSSPKALKKTLIYTGAFVVVAGISFALAGGEGTEKMVSAGLILFYILAIIATLLLVLSGIKNALIK